MALANYAVHLSNASDRTSRVLLIDWDLEAPGLTRFFRRHPQNEKQRGVIDFFESASQLPQNEWTVDRESPDLDKTPLGKAFSNHVTRDIRPNVDLMGPGYWDERYPARIAGFDWAAFYRTKPAFFDSLVRFLTSRYAHVLIDSRTGLTDVSGITTAIMPDRLVGVFTPNAQSLDGLVDVCRRAISFRKASSDLRSLSVFPLPSRVEFSEQQHRTTWRQLYQREFERLFEESYELKECDLSDYFDNVQLPHVAFYSYGENLAVEEEKRSESLSLSRALREFFRRIDLGLNAWSEVGNPWEGIAEIEQDRIQYDVVVLHGNSNADTANSIAGYLAERGLSIFQSSTKYATRSEGATNFLAAIGQTRALVLALPPDIADLRDMDQIAPALTYFVQLRGRAAVLVTTTGRIPEEARRLALGLSNVPRVRIIGEASSKESERVATLLRESLAAGSQTTDFATQSGPFQVGPVWVELPLECATGDRLRGAIRESQGKSFEWEILDAANLVRALDSNEQVYEVEQDGGGKGAYFVNVKIPAEGPWYLRMSAPRARTERTVRVELKRVARDDHGGIT